MAHKTPSMMVLLEDFNANLNWWYANDNTNIEGSKIGILIASFGFNQIINEPTNILHSFSFRIDLMFTSQPSLVIESGVHSSLHANCHRQITFAKFNLNAIYPPPYEREVALQTSEFRLYSTLNCQFLLGKSIS